MAKIHLYVRNEYAWEAFQQGVVNEMTATNQTKCGWVRQIVTSNIKEVTCKHCLREMEKDRH
ncbi:hypothetical protein C9J27_04330 [Photobacterium kishitanii]|uniref:Uncharacterized protein n=1 Tax=Photobacterium kishitanii TaxID=318456 RepID=A0A2T3KL33_9GAMM|nr:hypothetical protein C9J27_04330 [Photobacterium kishitanii]